MTRVIRVVGFAFLLLLMTVSFGSRQPKLPKIFAQENAVCEAVLTEKLTTMGESCADVETGFACFDSGETFSLDTVDRLQTKGITAEEERWEAAILKVDTGVEGQPVTLALFGDAEIANAVQVETDSGPTVTLNVRNNAGYNVNLREGPSTDTAIVGSFGWSATAIADGLSEDGAWVHLQLEDGTSAWIAKDFLAIDDGGDLSQLGIGGGNPYTHPMHALTLTTAVDETLCGVGSVGLLVQYAGEETTRLQINGVDLTFAAVTLLVHAQPEETLEFNVLAGELNLQALDENITAATGEIVRLELGGDSGLEVVAAPEVQPAYPFAIAQDLPLALVSEEPLTCIAGVPTDTTVTTFSLPDETANVSFDLSGEGHYEVTGRSEDEGWWQVSDGENQSWVQTSEVNTAGLCSVVQTVSPSTVSVPSTGGSGDSGTNNNPPVSSEGSLVPAGQSVWQATTSTDQMTGTCVRPPLPICSHLTAITPNGNTLSWRGQEPNPYNMSLISPNTYFYQGRNGLNDSTLTLTLTFTSSTAWSMTWNQVFDDDPACTHTYYYSAVPR